MSNAPCGSAPTGRKLDVETECKASDNDFLRLLEAAGNGCFPEQKPAQSNTVTHRRKPAGKRVDA